MKRGQNSYAQEFFCPLSTGCSYMKIKIKKKEKKKEDEEEEEGNEGEEEEK